MLAKFRYFCILKTICSMKVKMFFLPVLLSALVISVISCSKDDDKLNYHLELSKNSCEVMQGESVAIDLITHENTTLDIKNPELVDAVYTWNFDGNKAKIEIKGKQKGETNIVVTDHETGELATITVKVTAFPMPHLAVKQPKGNIFDMMNFYLYNEESKSIDSHSLSTVCDSIIWTADGMNGSFRVFEHGTKYHLTYTWEHCFKYPGEYKTNLVAWKDNKVIFRHQLDITITNNKDFLTYNWSDITKNSQAWTNYTDVLTSNLDLITTYGLSGIVPFAEVRVFGSDVAQSYHTLYDYFSKLYSVPTYTDQREKNKMWQRYDELFSEQKQYPNAHPVAIWVTKRANIALLLLDESTEFPGYVVYAEPNRQ